MIDIVIPGLRLPSLANARNHWHADAKIARDQRRAVSLCWPRDVTLYTKPTLFVFTRYGPRRLDPDNLARSCKHVQDQACQECNVSDGDPEIDFRYLQCKHRDYSVRIQVLATPKCECKCCPH